MALSVDCKLFPGLSLDSWTKKVTLENEVWKDSPNGPASQNSEMALSRTHGHIQPSTKNLLLDRLEMSEAMHFPPPPQKKKSVDLQVTLHFCAT